MSTLILYSQADNAHVLIIVVCEGQQGKKIIENLLITLAAHYLKFQQI